MAIQLTVARSYQVAGKSFIDQRTINGGEVIVREMTVGPAIAGTVYTPPTSTTTTSTTTTTTSTTTTKAPGGNQQGIITLASVTGFAVGNDIDIYWPVGGVTGLPGSLYSATIEGIQGSNLSFAGGTLWSSGDTFPAAGAVISAMVPVNGPLIFTGNQAEAILAGGDSGGTFIIDQAAPIDAYAIVVPSGSCSAWTNTDGTTNPVSGKSITQVSMSNGNIAVASLQRVAVLIQP